MRLIICVAAAAALCACQKQAEAPPAADNSADATNVAAPVTPAALTTINETSWEFTDNKTHKPMQESVDAAGKYITVSGKEHIDHGTAVMKDGKACFTSAMDKEGEVCWSDPKVAVGESRRDHQRQG